MKNKTKLMLALSILTAGTLAAGATGTFAWFTTNKTATANLTNIVVQGTQGNLNVSIGKVTDQSATINDSNPALVTATGAASYMTDVSSSDGLTFAQPKWKGTANITDAAFWSIEDVSTKQTYFTQYTITIKNEAVKGDASSTSIDLYLQSLTISGDKEVKDYVRVAINTNVSIDETNHVLKGGDNTQTTVYQNVTTNADYTKYVLPQTDEGTMTDALKTLTSVKAAGEKITDHQIGKLEAQANVTLGVSVWFEGTMANDQDTAKTKAVSVSMTFGDGAAK